MMLHPLIVEDVRVDLTVSLIQAMNAEHNFNVQYSYQFIFHARSNHSNIEQYIRVLLFSFFFPIREFKRM